MSGIPLVLHQFRFEQKVFWRSPAAVFFTVMFPVIFLFLMLPHINWFNPFSYFAVLLLLFVYAMNVVWCIKLLTKTGKVMPQIYGQRILGFCQYK